jgi:hypothetical protein
MEEHIDRHTGESPEIDEIGESAEAGPILLVRLKCVSDHGVLKGCEGKTKWRNTGKPCPEPEWSAGAEIPVSHTMDQNVRVVLTLTVPAGGIPQTGSIHGKGPGRMTFKGPSTLPPDSSSIELVSRQKLGKKIRKLRFELKWSAPGTGATIAPDRTSNWMYVTMDRPRVDRRSGAQEIGVTLRRMDKAMEWVEPLDTLDPHRIVTGLMAKFAHYALYPSPKVPKEYRHPHYMNAHGGAWPMTEYLEQSGECQAIVRLFRGILWQLGIPGDSKVIVFWADPNVDGGATMLRDDWEANPSAGLDARGEMNGRRVIAALVDAPVKEGSTYPPSHTALPGGRVSPGLNRYEACLEFSHGGKTRYYCGGAGVFKLSNSMLSVFWGLVWVSTTENDGFRVEKIVRRYRR